MSENRKHLITVVIPVRWSDRDVNAHVNNAVYFTYFEQTRVEWLDRQVALRRESSQGIVIAKASCDYLRPIPYPETLHISMYTGRVGRSSVTTHYEIYGADRETRYATGEAVVVWIDRSTGKSMPLPEVMRAALSG